MTSAFPFFTTTSAVHRPGPRWPHLRKPQPSTGQPIHTFPDAAAADIGAAMQAALDTFTEWKSVYIDYSGKLQRAQID